MAAFLRLARTPAAAAANQARGAFFLYSYWAAGYKSVAPSFYTHDELFVKGDRILSASIANILPARTTPYLIHRHGFAQKIAPPPHLQRQIGLKVYQGSPGVLIEPYRVHTPYPFLKRWFTREGWRQIKESILREMKTAYAVAKLRQKTGFTRKVFYSDVEKLYREINTSIAEGNWHAVKESVTEHMLSILKNEIKKREGIWDRVDWKLSSPVRINTLQARMAAVDPKDLDKAFIQITVMIKSMQNFGAFDQNGRLLAGDPTKKISVEDVWVFETFLGSPSKKFRLCGRITL